MSLLVLTMVSHTSGNGLDTFKCLNWEKLGTKICFYVCNCVHYTIEFLLITPRVF